MKYGFVLQDKAGNTYRAIASDFNAAETKVVSEHELAENSIVSIERGAQLN